MRADLPERLPLVCPRCRTRTLRGREMHTVALAATFRAAGTGAGAEVLEGALACVDPACGARYPILDGIPILVADLGALVGGQLGALVEGDLAPETAALLAGAGPDDAPYPQLIEHLSIYLDAHWGDRATPPPDGPAPAFGFAALAARVAERAAATVAIAVELGTSVGRGLAELGRGAHLAVGIDLHFGALRRARRLLQGEPLPYLRRTTGRRYATAIAQAGPLAAPSTGQGGVPAARSIALVCGDALDPPLAPGTCDRVLALNLLDAVRSAPQLLSVVDGLLRPGGEALLASPYSWQSRITDEIGPLAVADPAGALAGLLREAAGLEARYTIEDDADLPWSLRRDARSAHVYSVHYLRARKGGPQP